MRYRYQCPVRWSDLDLQGHVNNVQFVDFLQEARVNILAMNQVPVTGPEVTRGLVVVRNDITFRAPMPYLPEVSVEVWLEKLGAASFTLGYEIADHTQPQPVIFAHASSTLAPVELATHTLSRVSKRERDWLGQYQDDTEVLAPALVDGEPLARAPLGKERGSHLAVHVRFSDVDAYGHANNMRYFDYIQEGRVRWSTQLWNQFGAGKPAEYLMFLARAECRYRRPLECRVDPYDQWTWLSAMGRTSYTLDTVIEDNTQGEPQEMARARVVGVFVDPATGRPTEPSAEIRDLMVAALSG